ncbi:MAG TPA: rRNA maturation RNase YbeY [Candidatus Portnoybacteria bacterium]|nr:rRNA maturation RNase YbeY [Candidatus Portnoybacteria bacterium]
MIFNYTRTKINLALIQNGVNFILRELDFVQNKVDVFFISEKKIKDLNQRFRKINRSTDVLSFAERDQKEKFICPNQERNFLGEVYLCPAWIKKQAIQQGISFSEELTRDLIHGILHLVGYEHKGVSDAKAEEMFKLQEEMVEKIVDNSVIPA